MNKKLILRFRVVDRDNFLEIKNGLKVVETRAATPKYREVKVGDMLVIVCGKERLERKVKRVLTFTSIGSMVKRIPYKKIMPSIKSLSDLRQVYYGYPGYREKLKKYGVIAFDI
jgi:ASC-1-like (ASCH) protein